MNQAGIKLLKVYSKTLEQFGKYVQVLTKETV